MCFLLNSSVPEQYTLVPTWSHPPVAILSPSSYIYNLKRKRDSGFDVALSHLKPRISKELFTIYAKFQSEQRSKTV